MPQLMQMVLGLGSNLGPRLQYLTHAVRALAKLPRTRVMRQSAVYETPPLGPPQPDYLNAAVGIQTELAPLELLSHIQRIERRCGRQRMDHWGARTLDIDILWAGAYRMRHRCLTIPHPGLLKRAFALGPLLDVAPELRVQLGPKLQALGGRPRVVRHCW